MWDSHPASSLVLRKPFILVQNAGTRQFQSDGVARLDMKSTSAEGDGIFSRFAESEMCKVCRTFRLLTNLPVLQAFFSVCQPISFVNAALQHLVSKSVACAFIFQFFGG